MTRLFAALLVWLALQGGAQAFDLGRPVYKQGQTQKAPKLAQSIPGMGTGVFFAQTATPTITYTIDAIATGCSACNLGTLDFSTASAARSVCVAISVNGALTGGASITSVSLGGVAATIATQVFGAARAGAGVACAAVPTGATGNVTVNLSATNNVKVGVYAVYNLSSITATAFATDTTAAGGEVEDLSLNVQAGGVVIAAVADNNDSSYTSMTWAGTTTNAACTGNTCDYVSSVATGVYSAAHYQAVSASTPLTLTATMVTSSRGAGAAAAFR